MLRPCGPPSGKAPEATSAHGLATGRKSLTVPSLDRRRGCFAHILLPTLCRRVNRLLLRYVSICELE